MQIHRSRFALLLSVALVALSVTLAPAVARAEKPGAATTVAKPKAKAAAKPKPKAKAKAVKSSTGPVRIPRNIGAKPEAAPTPAPSDAPKDKDGKEEDPLERKNAGKADGHKWRPRVRA